MFKVARVLLAAMVMMVFTGCHNNLKEGFEQSAVEERAFEVIHDTFVEKSYKKVYGEMSEDIKQAMTLEAMAVQFQLIEERCGVFVEVDDYMVVDGNHPTEDKCAYVIFVLTFENKKQQCSLAFNESMEIVVFMVN